MPNDAWYYDNQFEAPSEDEPFLFVERIYCLDWDRFTVAERNRLEEILVHELPEFAGHAMSCPYWFGTDEENGPFLWASIEPPGLQVAGLLLPRNWEAWHERFLALTWELPWRVPR